MPLSICGIGAAVPTSTKKYFFSLLTGKLYRWSFVRKYSPDHPRWYAKWKFSMNIHTLHTRFCTFGTDLYARSVIINKISASELSWKFI